MFSSLLIFILAVRMQTIPPETVANARKKHPITVVPGV
jgi:hypothetical protein